MNNEHPPAFFLPFAPLEEQERLYADLARHCGCETPDARNRIYSVIFEHDSALWIATVGDVLRGHKPIWEGRKRTDRTVPIEDSAVVVAIFPGEVFQICTDSGIKQNRKSGWANPLWAGTPRVVNYFSPSAGTPRQTDDEH